MIEREQCCGCGACVNICPNSCISMEVDSLGFNYPRISEEKCNSCGLCEKVCPPLNKGNKEKSQPFSWAGHASSEKIRSSSSSGGLFFLFAKKILDDDGVVYGAALASDCKTVSHIEVKTLPELAKLQGSKYVQSNIGDCYKKAKVHLDAGRKVLFSGTPCQIDGLRLYLRKKYDNLLTIEVICHGTPSPTVFSKYVDYMSKKLGSKITKIRFRDETSEEAPCNED